MMVCVLVCEIGVSDVGESFRCDDDWCDGVMEVCC